MRNVYLHAGFHKTGTTSIQNFCLKYKQNLHEENFDFYEGKYINSNHAEIHAAFMRKERLSPFKVKNSNLLFDERFSADVEDRLSQFINNNIRRNLVFSNEGISYLRYHDEILRLHTFFLNCACLPKLVIYTRNKEDYLMSYKSQLEKMSISLSSDKESFSYIKNDSWLSDYDKRIQAFTHVFGKENVFHVDYDLSMHRDKNIIPSFLKILNLYHVFDPDSWKNMWLNMRSK